MGDAAAPLALAAPTAARSSRLAEKLYMVELYHGVYHTIRYVSTTFNYYIIITRAKIRSLKSTYTAAERPERILAIFLSALYTPGGRSCDAYLLSVCKPMPIDADLRRAATSSSSST